MRLSHLKERLAATPQANYPLHSRVHALRSFPSCYVKRDDELGLFGSKLRKYHSLIPFLLNQKIQEVIVIGSAYSNHVLGCIQLLIENGIQPTLFLRGDSKRSLIGNALFTSLFIPATSIQWFSKSQWSSVEAHAYCYAKQQSHTTFVLPEGGFCIPSLPGALTLALDIYDNEQEIDNHFDHIFIEAGTGFMASALILGLNWLNHPTTVHVILLAEDQKAFLTRLQQCHAMFTEWIEDSCLFPQNFRLYSSKLRFGRTSTLLFKTITDLAREEGFLTDPIYSAKLFLESKQLLAKKEIIGNSLIHHGGGAFTLAGFQNHLLKVLPTIV